MRLAEAIRLGAMMHPQAQGALAMKSNDGTVRTCALGAALCAVGYDPMTLGSNFNNLLPLPEWEQTWFTRVGQCPGCREICSDVQGTIIHLNDAHGWTRERIADWLDAFMAAQQPTVVPFDPAVPHPLTALVK